MIMKYLFLLLCITFGTISYSQDQPNPESDIPITASAADVALTTKHYGDKIVLRWAPINEEWWLYGMLNGYQIARKDMSDVSNRYEVLSDTIKPWSEIQIEEWFAAHPESEELAVPMKTMYQDWQNTNYTEANIADVFEKSTYFKQRHQMTILAADMYPLTT